MVTQSNYDAWLDEVEFGVKRKKRKPESEEELYGSYDIGGNAGSSRNFAGKDNLPSNR